MQTNYLPRLADKLLEEALRLKGAVLIEGPKWCGKTRTAKEKAASVLSMQDPDKMKNYLHIADTQPSLLLDGNTPRLIDEWQMAPVLWDAVRFAVDERGKRGQFILTGSATPSDNSTHHTGTGRITRFTMRPMTLFESQESNGSVSLQKLFEGNAEVGSSTKLTLKKLVYALCRGGWPEAVTDDEDIAPRHVHDYIDAVINIDINNVDDVVKNPMRVRALLRSLARNVATMATLKTIRGDIATNDIELSEKTISQYIDALTRLFVVEDLVAWSPAVRSKTGLRTSAKRHFIDPSIAAAVLDMSPEKLVMDFNTFGYLFESLCVRDLRVYAQMIRGEVYHYHERKTGLEADIIIHLKDGRWAAVEVKLGASEIEKAAKNLLKISNTIDTDKMNPPSFLMILTATEMAYRRKDGVYVVPIGCLKD